MDKMFEKLLEKKKGNKLPKEYKDAKMGVLKALHKEMGDMMGEDMKGMKKVTVASPSEEGLEMGLEKAQELMEGEGELCPECGEMHEEGYEGHNHEAMMGQEYEDMSVEDLDAEIKKLEEMKKSRMMG